MRRKEEAETMFWVIVRFLDIAQRDKVIANRLNIQNSIQILWYRVVAQDLWRLANFSEKIASKVIALESNRRVIGELLLSEILKISENAHAIAHKAVNSLFSSDIELANKTIEEYNTLQKMEEQLQEKICSHAYLRGKAFPVSKYFKGKEPIEPCMIAQLSFIIYCIRRMAELGSEIAEIAITKALFKQTMFCRKVPNEVNTFERDILKSNETKQK